MSTIWAICRRDTIAAFTTPMAWLVLACWTALINSMFVLGLYNVHGTAGTESPLFVGGLRLGAWLLILIAPAITMTSFASERAQGTLQLLLTVPVRELDIVLGKFCAAGAVLGSLLLATLALPATLLIISDVPLPHLCAGYSGLLLTGSFYAALGIWISVLVESPVAAYVMSFGALAVLHLIGWAGVPGSWFEPIAQAVGLGHHVQQFFTGDIRLDHVSYFVCGTALFLALAHHALCAKRRGG